MGAFNAMPSWGYRMSEVAAGASQGTLPDITGISGIYLHPPGTRPTRPRPDFTEVFRFSTRPKAVPEPSHPSQEEGFGVVVKVKN